MVNKTTIHQYDLIKEYSKTLKYQGKHIMIKTAILEGSDDLLDHLNIIDDGFLWKRKVEKEIVIKI